MEHRKYVIENPTREQLREAQDWFLKHAARDENGAIIPGQGIDVLMSDEAYERLRNAKADLQIDNEGVGK